MTLTNITKFKKSYKHKRTARKLYAEQSKNHFIIFFLEHDSYLIAPRRPPGQDVFVFGFVVERRRYKKQCKHTSKKASKTKLKKIKTRSRMIGERIRNHPQTLQNQYQIDPKCSKNEAKRDKTSNQRLQDDSGAPRKPIPPLSCAGQGPTWSPKSTKKSKKTI